MIRRMLRLPKGGTRRTKRIKGWSALSMPFFIAVMYQNKHTSSRTRNRTGRFREQVPSEQDA